MSKKYAIWNKQDPMITPIGEVLTAAQWMERYPAAALENITVVCAAGEINGAFFGTLGQMISLYEKQGCDFSDCATDEAKLAVIEAFEEEMNKPDDTPSAEERIAAAMEYQVMASMPDME